MKLYQKRNKRLLLVIALVILSALAPQTNIPVAKADFTPPSTLGWLGVEDTSGVFSTGAIDYEITNGTQYKGSQPYIRFRSSTTEPIILDNCVADYRLIRVEDNYTLTETDYARVPILSLGSTYGQFWASMITDYNTTYLVGVVIWNASDGTVVGRLIRTIQVSDSPLVSLTSDKEEYGQSDDVFNFTVVNHGPPVLIDLYPYHVYQVLNGTWLWVKYFGPPVPLMVRFESIEHEETYKFSILRSLHDFSSSGSYGVTSGGYGWHVPLSAEFRVVSSGVDKPIVVTPSIDLDWMIWILVGVSIIIIVQLFFFYYYSRKRV